MSTSAEIAILRYMRLKTAMRYSLQLAAALIARGWRQRHVWPRMLELATHLTQDVTGDSGTEGEGAWR